MEHCYPELWLLRQGEVPTGWNGVPQGRKEPCARPGQERAGEPHGDLAQELGCSSVPPVRENDY